jgi:protease-4
MESALGLNEILQTIEKATKDDNIKGILLETKMLQCGPATVQEIRDALLKFKSSGKFIVSFADSYSQSAYYLATVADKIYMNPEGIIELKGLVAGSLYFKKTLDRLGLRAEVVKCGKYKSATEPFLTESMSPENREQLSLYVNGVWSVVSSQIVESRSISAKKLDEITTQLAGFDAQTMKENGLVDGLRYRSQAIGYIDSLLAYKGDEHAPTVKLEDYITVPQKKEKFHKDKIAVIYAAGSIVDDGEDDAEIVGKKYAEEIEKAVKDKSVKAIVLRVNSGGGSALASEQIRFELAKAKGKKPVVVSMGDYAASGGYWISTPADVIVAQPTTLTGSIGVFGLFFNAEQGIKEKLGINPEIVKTHASADVGSVFRSMSTAEKLMFQKTVNKVYDRFVGLVSESRSLPTQKVLELGQGHIWTGIDGKKLGLVDEFGGLEKAISIAAKRANITAYRIEELPEIKDIFAQIMDAIGETKTKQMVKTLGPAYVDRY